MEIQELSKLYDKYEKLWVVCNPSRIRIIYRDRRNILDDYLWNIQHNKPVDKSEILKMCSTRVSLRAPKTINSEEIRKDNEKLRIINELIINGMQKIS